MYLRGEVCPTSPLDADPSPLWRQTPLDADPLDTDPSLRMQTPHPRGRPSTLDADPPWRQTPWSRDLWCMLGNHPPPHPPWTEWQMLVKILPCPQLRLRVVRRNLLDFLYDFWLWSSLRSRYKTGWALQNWVNIYKDKCVILCPHICVIW